MRVKAWGPLWALFSLIALIGFGLFEYGIPNRISGPAPSPSQYQQPSNSTIKRDSNPSNAKSNKEQKSDEPLWVRPTDILLVSFNGLLALFTYLLYKATSGLFTETAGLRTAADQQAVDMKASIKAATDAARAAITSNQISVTMSEQQLRAYVTAKSVNLDTHRKPGRFGTYGNFVEGAPHTYAFSVVLRNGGQPPAINVVMNVSCQRLLKELNTSYPFPDSKLFGHGLIGPDGEMLTPVIRINAPELEVIDEIHCWYFWGWVEYDDIFTASGSTSRHRTEFCFQIDQMRLPVTNELWIGFKPYYRFNSADWDCLRPIDPLTNKSESG